jgi:NitT/TauT family transport system substrate-binding protein
MSRRTAVVALAALFLIAAVTAVVLTTPKEEANKPPQAVQIGYLPIYVDLPLFVAKERGFFEKHGVRADLHRFGKSPEIADALNTGEIQFGASIAYASVLATESRDPGRLKIFIADAENPEAYLSSIVIPKDSTITGVSDLVGKTIVSFPGPTAVTFLKLVLKKNGVDPASVTIQELDISLHIDALVTGKADALFTYEPTATQAVVDAEAIKIVPGAVERDVINPWQAGVWVVSSEFARTDPDTTRRVIAALYEAVDYMRANPREAKAALTNYTSIRQDVALRTPNIPFTKMGEIDLPTLQKQTDILTEAKIVSRQMDATELLVPADWLPR